MRISYSHPLCFLILTTILWGSSCDLPPGPKPFCDVKTIPMQLPMTIDEILSVDLSNHFVGYNLQYLQIRVKNFAYMKPNFYSMGSQVINVSEIINSKINYEKNVFGHTYSLLAREMNQIVLYVGLQRHPNVVPQLSDAITVQTDPNVNCYDVEVFSDLGIAIVDCVNATLTKDPVNLFYYVNLANKSVSDKIPNEKYSNFTHTQKRKLITFSNLHTGFRYIMRAYIRNPTSTAISNDNTYVQIFNANDIKNLEPLSVIDRSLMKLSKLSITDVTYYLDQVIILDYYSGVYRYRFDVKMHPVLKGYYKCKHFLKMAVYSDDFEEEFLVAIANSHAIHEIDWQQLDTPVVKTKYSLISNTNITSLALSLNFVVVTGSSWAVSNQKQVLYNYTWIFNKKSRSFTNAYKVISHNFSDSIVHFDPSNQYVLVTNKTKIVNYDLSQPILIINQFDSKALGTSETLQLSIQSADYIDNKKDVCNVNITIHFVQRTNIDLWPTNIPITQTFYSNYPGELIIPLRRYAFGPNITYSYFKPFSQKIQAQNWVHKQNHTLINMNKPITHPINFLRTDVVNQYGSNNIIAYYQDTTNNTYLSFCRNQYYTPYIECSIMTEYEHSSKINAMTTGFIRGTFGDVYINIFNLEGELNKIYIYQFGRSEQMFVIEYPTGFEGRVTDLDLTNGFLYVTIPSMKRIDGYNLQDCTDKCKKIIQIDANRMSSLGVPFFSPKFITCTRAHPQVLFISSIDSVIIVDVDNHNNIVVLQQLITTGTSNPNFKIAANEQYLYIASPPTLIEQYKFQDLHRGKVTQHKTLELYSHRIPQNFDMQFNDVGNLFYITAFDIHEFTNIILIYESGNPLVSSLYDVVYLGRLAKHNIEIEVSGSKTVDFLTIMIDDNITIVKQYEIPSMIIKDAEESFSFYIKMSNSQDSSKMSLGRVMIANYPDNFNKSINYPDYTNRFLQKIEESYTWNDHGWFEGNIIGYRYKCQDCPDKIEFVSHIEQINQREIHANDFCSSPHGGYILWNDVLKLNTNGTIFSVSNIPQVAYNDQKQDCVRVVAQQDILVVTACTTPLSTVSLYVTSNLGYKSFTMGPWKTNSEHLTDLHIVNGLLMIVDVSPNAYLKHHNGGIYLYSLDLDSLDEESTIQEIDYIDNDDLAGAATWDTSKQVFVGNAYLSFHNHFRLYASELTQGLIITTFDWARGDPQLNIKVVDYINIPSILAQYHFSMPSDATFAALTVLSFEQTQNFEIENLIMTTSNFHHFEFKIVYQKSDGRIGYVELVKVYYRYGYYLTYNQVRAYNGFVVVPYIIPTIQDKFSNYSKQHVAVYDSKEYSDDIKTPEGYLKRYIFAAQTIENRTETVFNFNKTESSQSTAGLVIVNPIDKTVFETIVNRNLTIKIKDPNFYSQNMFIWPYSDFYRYMFQFRILGLEDKSLKGWQIALIVIGAIIVAAALGVAGWFLFKRVKRKLKQTVLMVEDADEESDDIENKNVNPLRINQSLEMPDQFNIKDHHQKQLEVEIKQENVQTPDLHQEEIERRFAEDERQQEEKRQQDQPLAEINPKTEEQQIKDQLQEKLL